MFTVNKITIFDKTTDKEGKEVLAPFSIFSVCDGLFCFYFSSENEAREFCFMLNWLLDSEREYEVSELIKLAHLKNFERILEIQESYRKAYEAANEAAKAEAEVEADPEPSSLIP